MVELTYVDAIIGSGGLLMLLWLTGLGGAWIGRRSVAPWLKREVASCDALHHANERLHLQLETKNMAEASGDTAPVVSAQLEGLRRLHQAEGGQSPLTAIQLAALQRLRAGEGPVDAATLLAGEPQPMAPDAETAVETSVFGDISWQQPEEPTK